MHDPMTQLIKGIFNYEVKIHTELTLTPCRSLLGTGGATTASLVLIMGTMFIRNSS